MSVRSICPLAAAVACAAALYGAEARACSCAAITPQEEVDYSSVVLRGTVTASTPHCAFDCFLASTSLPEVSIGLVEIDVAEVYKGTAFAHETMLQVVEFCGYPEWQVGQELLVLGVERFGHMSIASSFCMSSKPIEEAADILALFDGGTGPADASSPPFECSGDFSTTEPSGHYPPPECQSAPSDAGDVGDAAVMIDAGAAPIDAGPMGVDDAGANAADDAGVTVPGDAGAGADAGLVIPYDGGSVDAGHLAIDDGGALAQSDAGTGDARGGEAPSCSSNLTNHDRALSIPALLTLGILSTRRRRA